MRINRQGTKLKTRASYRTTAANDSREFRREIRLPFAYYVTRFSPPARKTTVSATSVYTSWRLLRTTNVNYIYSYEGRIRASRNYARAGTEERTRGRRGSLVRARSEKDLKAGTLPEKVKDVYTAMEANADCRCVSVYIYNLCRLRWNEANFARTPFSFREITRFRRNPKITEQRRSHMYDPWRK